VSEFRMPVPWGEMRGRVWGPDHGRPVLCLHGWSDNSGSFNTLIPLLPAGAVPPYTTIKPQHYHVLFLLYVIIIIYNRYTERTGFVQSAGGNIGGMISALYPDMVESLVLLDSYGFLPIDAKRMNRIMCRGIEEMLEYEKKVPDRKERIYTYEAAKERLKAANRSLSDKSVEILLERGIQMVDGGVVFTRDIRINLTNIVRTTLEQSLHLQSQINAKVLMLWASHGLQKTFPQAEDLAGPLLKGWSGRNTSFETVEGDHHVHLNNPEIVAPVITDFL
ncbi:serine hydrolase-like protein, partial [Silurus asotus]